MFVAQRLLPGLAQFSPEGFSARREVPAASCPQARLQGWEGDATHRTGKAQQRLRNLWWLGVAATAATSRSRQRTSCSCISQNTEEETRTAEREVLKRRVVLVGPSQSGKSTFGHCLHQLARAEVPSCLQVGDGNTSCTDMVTKYKLSTPALQFDEPIPDVPTDILNAGDNLDKAKQIIQFKEYKANVQPSKEGPVFELEVFDTPGFDDTDARADAAHAYNILKAVNSAGSVDLIIFVIGKGVSYSGSFKRVFEQYWNLFPRFHDHFVVLHTKWDAWREQAAEKNKRMDAFKAELPDADLLPQYFIDSHCQRRQDDIVDYSEIVIARAAQTFNALLKRLSHYKPVATSDLKYYKTDSMRALDQVLEETLRRTVQDGEASVLEAGSVSDTAHYDLDVLGMELAELEAEDKEVTSQIQALMKGDPVTVASERVMKGRHPLGLGRSISVHLETKIPVVEKEEIATRGQWTQVKSYDGGKVVTAIFTAEFWGKAEGMLLAKGRSSEVHAAEIKDLEKELRKIKLPLRAKRREYKKAVEKSDLCETEMDALRNLQKRRTEALGFLKNKYMSLHDYIHVKDLYENDKEEDNETLLEQLIEYLTSEASDTK